MRILLSTIGSRGDVQPLVALGLQLKALGQDVRLCVPPDFQDWIEGLGLSVTPIGPKVRAFAVSTPQVPASPPSPEQRRQMIEGTVATQFETISMAAQDCDILVGATALQVAAPSVAEKMGIPYFFAAYSPAVLPSPHHAPPVLGILGDKPVSMTDYSELWVRDAERWNATWTDVINSHRAAHGLDPISDVRGYILTDQPWLAADPTLAPWPDPGDDAVFQTGAWIIEDKNPLSPELERFLDVGEPPIYFGFGSSRATQELSRTVIDCARALGRRVIVSKGWADVSMVGNELDCLEIGEVNVLSLFKRVAAVVHHGGAGTTTAAARSGAPQVVIPQHYDQHYFAGRVQQLGIGAAHSPDTPTIDSLTNALEYTLQPDVVVRAESIAGAIHNDGTQVAAQRLISITR